MNAAAEANRAWVGEAKAISTPPWGSTREQQSETQGIDGGRTSGNMWFKSRERVRNLPGLKTADGQAQSALFYGIPRGCMVVVSS